MGTLQLNTHGLATTLSVPYKFNFIGSSNKAITLSRHFSFSRGKIRAVSSVAEGVSVAKDPDEPPAVDFAFVHSVLLPDGTPDVHFRRACGGQKLRDIMLDNNIELYGPYARPLLNCAGGGTCGTCMMEVVEGKELLNPRTDKEKEKLKTIGFIQPMPPQIINQKTWRLACRATVGKPDSKGLLVIQQLPEWKVHEWTCEKIAPSEEP